MSKLVICEKPSVAQSAGKVLGAANGVTATWRAQGSS